MYNIITRTKGNGKKLLVIDYGKYRRIIVGNKKQVLKRAKKYLTNSELFQVHLIFR